MGLGKSYLSTMITLYIAVCLNLMRNPWQYFGLNVATQLSQLLVSYSLKKSSELLLEPFLSLLEASPFFERCQRMDQMKEAEAEYQNSESIDKIYWTTAYPTSALGFSSGSTIKIASSPNGLLGLSIVSIVYSELAFFTDAGKTSEFILKLYNDGKARVRSRLETSRIDTETGNKIVDYYGRALSYNESILTESGEKLMKNVSIGDNVKTPNGFSTVDCIPFDEEDDLYEITLSDGKTIKCNLNHLWPCEINSKKELLSTEEIINKSEFEKIYFYESINSSIKLISIYTFKKVGRGLQKCIHLNDGIGEFYLANGVLTHNCILDSSPNDMNNAIDQYIVNEAHNDKTNYIVEGSRWKWRPDEYKQDFETGNIFKVYLGSNGNPPRILENNDPLLEENTSDQNKIITVPGSFRQVFKDDLKKALKDWAGIPTGSANSLLYDYTPLEAMFNNNLRNIYLNIEAPSMESPTELIWRQIAPKFFNNKGGIYTYYYKPYIPRCVSVDQSYANDVTSISMTHIERLGDTGEIIYVVDFSIAILPTKKSNVNLEAIRCFIEDLRSKGNLNIEHISFDQFQSETTIQNLSRQKFDVEKLSVDRTMDAYLNFVSLINTHRVVCGKNIFLKNNLKSLNIVRPKTDKGKTKIDHDNSREQVFSGDESWETSKIGYFGKDVSDSVCASIELCRKYYNVAEETWTGGPKSKSNSEQIQYNEAKEETSKLLEKMGLK